MDFWSVVLYGLFRLWFRLLAAGEYAGFLLLRGTRLLRLRFDVLHLSGAEDLLLAATLRSWLHTLEVSCLRCVYLILVAVGGTEVKRQVGLVLVRPSALRAVRALQVLLVLGPDALYTLVWSPRGQSHVRFRARLTLSGELGVRHVGG